MGARLSPQALTNRAVSLKATAQKDWSSDSELQRMIDTLRVQKISN